MSTSSQLAEVVFRGCQFVLLAAPPVTPSYSPHQRGPSRVELWSFIPPGALPPTIPTTPPELRASRGAGQCAPALPHPPHPKRTAADLTPRPRSPVTGSAVGAAGAARRAGATRIKSCQIQALQSSTGVLGSDSLAFLRAVYPLLVTQGRQGDRLSVPQRQSRATVPGRKNLVTCTWCLCGMYRCSQSLLRS